MEEENATLRDELKKLNSQLKRVMLEAKQQKILFDRVSRAAEAKNTLGTAISSANTRQKAYTDILLENCPSIIILLDEFGRFVLSTRALMDVTGTPNFDFIKNRGYQEVFEKHFSQDTMREFMASVESVTSSGSDGGFEAWIDFSGNGQPRLYIVEMRRVGNGQDGIAGILVVMDDLTDIMREKHRAEAANNAKSDFLAAMSHEIRTPMNVVFGMVTALDRLGLSEQHQKYIDDIRRASDSLLSIINDILDFSKIEAGKLEIFSESYSLSSLLHSLNSMFSLMYAQKHLSIEFNINPDLPTHVHGDENRLRQILTNLLSNAFKYTDKGGVVLSAWLDGKGNMRFDVQDTGQGIREEDVNKLFAPFEQLDTRRNRNISGTGLGLSITYKLCQIMGGDIWVNSVHGEGSTFSVQLPCNPVIMAAEADETEIHEFTAPDAMVLVVDDMETNLTVAEVMLEIFDIFPDVASSGEAAVNMASINQYDIIFMDHMMPGMDGIEATAKIRAMGGHNSSVPIIALTANAIKGAEEMFIAGGLNDMLPKPLEHKALNECLQKWLPPHIIQ